MNVTFRDRSWDLLSDQVSAVYRDGAVQCIYAETHDALDDRSMIVQFQTAGQPRTVVETQSDEAVFRTFTQVRVSPNERFLAYALYSKQQALFGGPREELFVMDLRSREVIRIGGSYMLGNLIWSPDGDRLYYAMRFDSRNASVYVAEVGAAFERAR